jgi:hypothetical protein
MAASWRRICRLPTCGDVMKLYVGDPHTEQCVSRALQVRFHMAVATSYRGRTAAAYRTEPLSVIA